MPRDRYYGNDYASIKFLDQVTSQAPPEQELGDLVFVDVKGQPVRLKDYVGKKQVVLVITRGYAGSICLYCSAQTSRLIANNAEFTKRGAEVVVVSWN